MIASKMQFSTNQIKPDHVTSIQMLVHSISVRRTLYLGLVRAHLGYATQDWAPQGIELISKLERIQRRATKFILCLPFLTNISYKERLIYVNLLPVCYWHELLDLIYFYKATHNMIHLDPYFCCSLRARLRAKDPYICNELSIFRS